MVDREWIERHGGKIGVIGIGVGIMTSVLLYTFPTLPLSVTVSAFLIAAALVVGPGILMLPWMKPRQQQAAPPVLTARIISAVMPSLHPDSSLSLSVRLINASLTETRGVRDGWQIEVFDQSGKRLARADGFLVGEIRPLGPQEQFTVTLSFPVLEAASRSETRLRLTGADLLHNPLVADLGGPLGALPSGARPIATPSSFQALPAEESLNAAPQLRQHAGETVGLVGNRVRLYGPGGVVFHLADGSVERSTNGFVDLPSDMVAYARNLGFSELPPG